MNAEERIAELFGESTADFEAERLILNATELILGLMEHEGLTRSGLAERIGKSKGHVSQLLNGERNMTLRTLAEIAHAVGHRIEVRVSDLQAPPNYPVIVLHTDDGDGLTACTGQPMPGPAGDVYRNVPRYFCEACARVNVYEEEEMMDISADDLLYEAWAVIANAGWDGAGKSEGWQEAAVRWRDKWHAYLDSRTAADAEEE
jgi:transcriptional regulator with XRE-family HTH domain